MNSTTGRVLYVDNQYTWKAVGYNLYHSNDDGGSWKKIISIPSGMISLVCSKLSLTRRLFRKGVYKMVQAGGNYVVFSDKSIYIFYPQKKSLRFVGYIKGSRPLYACVFNNKLFYGEYISNVQRNSVSIHSYDLIKNEWVISREISGVRHIHGVFVDPYEKKMWITTGDYDSECSIRYTDDEFKTLKVFVSGSQKFRAIYLHFSKDTICYGTDAPDNKNYIRTLLRKTGNMVGKVAVGGPVFFGGVSPGYKFLTTVVEPSAVNVEPYAEFWFFDSDNIWKRAFSIKKDLFPKKLFQYGQIWIPEGPGKEGVLWFTPIACSVDYKAVSISTKDLGQMNETI